MSQRNIRLALEYDGTDFVGWQLQREGRSVQGVLEAAIHEMTSESARVYGAGRTDSGVHARGQIANFFTHAEIPILGFQRGLNVILARDIAVLDATEMPLDFDARRSARGKRYLYRIWNQEVRSPLEERTSWYLRAPLALDPMREAAGFLLGEHDFAAFGGADDRDNTVRTVRRLEVAHRGDVIEIEFEATAFLKYMCRIIVGTLVEVGRGERAPEDVREVLLSRDRARAGITAPPHGLCLAEVFY